MTEGNFILTHEAIEDVKKASIWYADQKHDLGDYFQTEVFHSINTICKFPFSYLKYNRKSDIRRFLMKRFPYKIFYDPSVEPLKIIAVVHASRSLGYISKRIK